MQYEVQQDVVGDVSGEVAGALSKSLSKEMSDNLLQAFQQGEDWAFSEIYEKFRTPVLNYVSGRIGDRDSAQDLVQEVFVKLYRFRNSFRPQHGFSSWFWTIVRNTISDLYRKNRPEEMACSNEDELAAPGPDAETFLDRKSKRKMLKKFLKNLTGLQRKVIWLRVMHQLSYEEISKRLGLSLSAVKCLAYRSKLALKQLECSPA